MNKRIKQFIIYCEGKDEVQFLKVFINKFQSEFVANFKIKKFKDSFDKTSCKKILEFLTNKAIESDKVEVRRREFEGKSKNIFYALVDEDKYKCKHKDGHNEIKVSKICFDTVWYELVGLAIPNSQNCIPIKNDLKRNAKKIFKQEIQYNKDNYFNLLKNITKNKSIEDFKDIKSEIIKLIIDNHK